MAPINQIIIDRLIRIHLKLQFTDPDKDSSERNFPEGFKLKMKFEKPFDGGRNIKDAKIGKKSELLVMRLMEMEK